MKSGRTLHDMRARILWLVGLAWLLLATQATAFYDPGLQRWINRDPLGDVASLPVMTTGLTPWSESDGAGEMAGDEFFAAWIDINRNLHGALENNPIERIDAFGLCDDSLDAAARSNPGELGKLAREAADEGRQFIRELMRQKEAAKKALRDSLEKVKRIKKSLDKRHLDAARKELDGKVVARKADGTVFDHVTEVRDAQRGLANQIESLKDTLARTPKGSDEAKAVEEAVSELSKFLDKTTGWCPRK